MDDRIRPTSTETLLRATKFTVQRWTFRNDRIGTYAREVVLHPGAVVAIPLASPTELIMIHQVREAVGQTLFELPAGTLEVGEPPADCARREVEEEIGYRAGSIQALCEFYTCPGICTERMHAFVAEDLVRTETRREATEQIRIEVIALDRVMQMIGRGEIQDAKTIAALSVYHLRQGMQGGHRPPE